MKDFPFPSFGMSRNREMGIGEEYSIAGSLHSKRKEGKDWSLFVGQAGGRGINREKKKRKNPYRGSREGGGGISSSRSELEEKRKKKKKKGGLWLSKAICGKQRRKKEDSAIPLVEDQA